MFHRMKSETQNEPQNYSSVNEQDEGFEAEGMNMRTEYKPQAPQSYAASYVSENNAKQQKDTKPMTDQPKNEGSDAPRNLDIPSNAYARSPSTPASRPYQAPSFAPGKSYSQLADRAEDNDRKLTIGRGITMSGEIESCDHLYVEGTVEAALKGASLLDIAESGVFYGTVEIDEATIAGRFEGEITVNGRLTIKSSGTITGTISYKELQVEAGAVIDGRLTPFSAVGAARQGGSAQDQKARGGQKRMGGQKSVANSDGELFGDSKATAAE